MLTDDFIVTILGHDQDGEDVCVMGPHLTEDLHHLGAGRVHASPHVEQRHRRR